MPVTLQALNAPDERDLAELERLAAEQLDCPSYCRAWQQWLADPTTVTLYVARFNERIVGAVLLAGGEIVGFAVRAATRRRGVGQRMLDLVLAQTSAPVSLAMNAPTRVFIERYRAG
ncbi:acetyl-CoA sensor PanZ family protein [Saccharospirillum mangrovi]|uniref:acetyl-CoA sensor PanZ family protein n=1 Tax=Saccharospirillum mangrovi TaxID=2161747 RepID=UPI001300A28F|nr:acetyl-CoA sensor PanZ family protein [Saccharospirillum mangrovi]